MNKKIFFLQSLSAFVTALMLTLISYLFFLDLIEKANIWGDKNEIFMVVLIIWPLGNALGNFLFTKIKKHIKYSFKSFIYSFLLSSLIGIFCFMTPLILFSLICSTFISVLGFIQKTKINF